MKEISLRIVLQNAIEGIRYGLQQGNAAAYETVQAQTGNGQDLIFHCTIRVKERNGAVPAISGPFVQGAAGSRFIYIGIGSYAGQTGVRWNGRLKVPLAEAAFETIQPDEDDAVWTCTVPGSNKEGQPVFATVKPFNGWFRN